MRTPWFAPEPCTLWISSNVLGEIGDCQRTRFPRRKQLFQKGILPILSKKGISQFLNDSTGIYELKNMLLMREKAFKKFGLAVNLQF